MTLMAARRHSGGTVWRRRGKDWRHRLAARRQHMAARRHGGTVAARSGGTAARLAVSSPPAAKDWRHGGSGTAAKMLEPGKKLPATCTKSPAHHPTSAIDPHCREGAAPCPSFCSPAAALIRLRLTHGGGRRPPPMRGATTPAALLNDDFLAESSALNRSNNLTATYSVFEVPRQLRLCLPLAEFLDQIRIGWLLPDKAGQGME
eukprot:gene8956-biopygen5056